MDFTIFFNIIGSASFIGILVFGIKKYIQYAVQNGFKKELEQYKSDLQKESEVHRNELNRELEGLKHRQQMIYKDFELYTSKIHETYPELYKNVETAIGYALGMQGKGRIMSFENTNKDDLKGYFETMGITNYDQERILDIWESDQDKAIHEIYRTIGLIKYNETRLKWSNANDYFIYNELYLSDNVANCSRELLKILFDYIEVIDPDYVHTARNAGLTTETKKETKELKEKVNEAREKLKVQLKNELSSSRLANG